MNAFIKTGFMLSIIGTLSISIVTAYDSTDLAGEQSALMSFQNRLIRDTICCYLNMKKAEPVLGVPGQITFSADLSFGDAVAPLFFYNIDNSQYPLFGPLENIYGSGEDMPAVNLSLAAAFPADLLGTIDVSFLPALNFKNASVNNFKIGASLYYHLLKDALFMTGLYAGTGYSYTSGSLSRQMNQSAVIEGTNASYTGNFNSGWNYNGLNLEIFADNQLFMFNFYGRLDYYCLFGQAQTGFAGSSSLIQNADNFLPDNSIVQGLVFSAGMEIAIGWFKLNVEAGKDFLSSGMYINTGIRLGY